MRFHVAVVALMCLMLLIGCESILMPDPFTKSPAEQQQDRHACATIAARAAQDYAWDPLADLATIRADRESECLESRGYVTTTKVTMRASPAGNQPGHTQQDPVRRCFQQAYGWLGHYDGPIDGRPNAIWTAAQQAYLTEQQIVSDHPDAPHLVRDSLLRNLQALGRAADWQLCLQEATEPKS
jgi:hypothetical protein